MSFENAFYYYPGHVKVGLITPYTGSNLGDGAIQDAVVSNLKIRLPHADFTLFSLNPVKTTVLHGIPSQPITGMIIQSYSTTLKSYQRVGKIRQRAGGELEGLKSRLKPSKAYRPLLKPLWWLTKGFTVSILNISRETRHTCRVWRALREFKLLIVSGGGQIDDYWGGWLGHPLTLAKWALLAKLRGVPLVFLSVGHCALDSGVSRWLVRQALKRADYRSFRDQGSKKLLAQMAFTRNDEVIPDLAFSYPVNAVSIPKAVSLERLTIGISPIAYLLASQWPKSDMGAFNRYIGKLAAFSVHLMREGHNILVFATDGPDRIAVDLLIERIEKHHLPENSSLKRVEIDSVHHLMGVLRDLDAAVVSRLHGVILSHLCGVPVLAVSYDRKVTRYMADMGQKRFCLEIETMEHSRLQAMFISMLVERETILNSLKAQIADHRTALDRQYDEIAALARGTVSKVVRPYNLFNETS
jgi:polysaccharide pyruvyl transferase WcaK-like protein